MGNTKSVITKPKRKSKIFCEFTKNKIKCRRIIKCGIKCQLYCHDSCIFIAFFHFSPKLQSLKYKIITIEHGHFDLIKVFLFRQSKPKIHCLSSSPSIQVSWNNDIYTFISVIRLSVVFPHLAQIKNKNLQQTLHSNKKILFNNSD